MHSKGPIRNDRFPFESKSSLIANQCSVHLCLHLKWKNWNAFESKETRAQNENTNWAKCILWTVSTRIECNLFEDLYRKNIKLLGANVGSYTEKLIHFYTKGHISRGSFFVVVTCLVFILCFSFVSLANVQVLKNRNLFLLLLF